MSRSPNLKSKNYAVLICLVLLAVMLFGITILKTEEHRKQQNEMEQQENRR